MGKLNWYSILAVGCPLISIFMIFEFCRLTDAEIVENAVTVLLLTNATLIVGIVASYFSGWKMGKSINEMEEDDFYDTHQ